MTEPYIDVQGQSAKPEAVTCGVSLPPTGITDHTQQRRFRSPVWAVLASVAAAGLLASCGTPVRLNGVEVDKEVAFLTVVEEQWRGDERGGADPYAVTARDTGCWLARDRESGAVQSSAFCGPIRHLTGETPDGMFDQLTFHPEFVGDQVRVAPEAVELTAAGVPAPNGLQLYSPRAGKPADSKNVAPPEAPQAAAGLITAVDDGLIEAAIVPLDSLIIGPNLQVSITKTGTVSFVTGGGEEGDTAPYYRPAEGEEFLAFTVRRNVLNQFDEGYLGSDIDLSAAYTVRSATGQTSITPMFDDYADSDVTVVISLPTGQDAELVIGVAGVDQTMSIRTGRRTSDTAAAYYRGQTGFALQKQYSSNVSKGDFRLRHGITFTDATVSPFDPSRGWAPSGQMYLTVACQNVMVNDSGYYYGEPSFNTKASVTATTAENKTTTPLGGFPGSNLEANLSELTFQVPEATQSIKIRYQPKGTFAVASPWGPDDVSPDRGHFSFKPTQLEIDLH